MNCTRAQTAALIEGVLKPLATMEDVDIVVCPPFTSLAAAQLSLKGSKVKLGAQDVFWTDEGAFTGRISPRMLMDVGVSHCILGHSETRGKFGKLEVPAGTVSTFAENDVAVNLKLKALLFNSLVPILCIGETIAERDAGQTDRAVRSQLDSALSGIDPDELKPLVIAYEPVWAIGTGKTCDAGEAQRVCAMIRQRLEEMWLGFGLGARILYGGSVKPSNAKDLFAQPDIDGALVGGASLDAQDFTDIIRAAAKA